MTMLSHWTQQDLAAVAAAASGGASLAVSWTADQAAMHFVGVPLQVLLAAFAGALASLSFSAAMRLPKLIGTVAASTAIGSYLQPPVEVILNGAIGIKGMPIAVAFGLALVSQAAVGWALKSLPEILDRLRGGAR